MNDVRLVEGVTVLDFGSALAAPYAAMMLADLGAEVVKVEKPRRGDLIRYTDKYVDGASGYFLGINRGKRGVSLDLRKPRGQEIARRLCATADVVVENFRPGVMASWGLGYEDVRAVREDVVYCSVSAFAEAKGFEGHSGNDIVAQAYSGIMAMTGDAEGGPAKAGAPVIDVAASCMATIGILGALVRRGITGAGAHVETSLIEAAFALMPNYTASLLNGSPQFRRLGSGHPQLAPYEAYPAADGRYVVVGAFHEESWRRLCAVLERPDLIGHPDYADNTSRVRHRHQLNAVLAAELARRPADHWVSAFAEGDVPASPVLEVEESIALFTDRNPDLVCAPERPDGGTLRMLRAPFRIDGVRPASPRSAPDLGADTADVLARVGVTPAELEDLRAAGVV